MVRVAVVDDQALVREGMSLILEAHPAITVTAQYSSGAELLAADLTTVDIVLLDLYLPGPSGLEVLQQLTPPPRVLMVSTIGRPHEIRQALAAGAAGFVLKDATGEELAAAVHGVHSGLTVVSPAVSSALQVPARPGLTPREGEVLGLLGAGLSNRDIALALGLAERTVKVHVGHVLAKLGVRSRTQAALLAQGRS
ncbi:response regulator transcription factor [Actinocrispum sp. NPDC049592]|uniref:response regulator transcription factor n=1 Tax=Actinocrispum sp. NPDC049592 TaxID=3154835 RepID=UPI00342D13D9